MHKNDCHHHHDLIHCSDDQFTATISRKMLMSCDELLVINLTVLLAVMDHLLHNVILIDVFYEHTHDVHLY